jgi:hypothetical protein
MLCGDFNINHLEDNRRKQLFKSLLDSFNLSSTVKFLTQICKTSSTLTDNIYINTNFLVHPFTNGISDNDV